MSKQSIVEHCEHCHVRQKFSIEGQYTDNGGPDGDYPPCEYTLARCENCSYPALMYREYYDEYSWAEESYTLIYPVQKRKILADLPPLVKDSYEEAVACERHKLNIACVILVGRTLEAICRHQVPANSKTLASALKKLNEDGIISNELYEWANELKTIRNFGAHATEEKITMEDASESLDFLQAIVEILYDLRPKFNKLKLRRSKGLASS